MRLPFLSNVFMPFILVPHASGFFHQSSLVSLRCLSLSATTPSYLSCTHSKAWAARGNDGEAKDLAIATPNHRHGGVMPRGVSIKTTLAAAVASSSLLALLLQPKVRSMRQLG